MNIWFEGEDKFSSEHVIFDMPLRHSRGDAKKPSSNLGLELKDLSWRYRRSW